MPKVNVYAPDRQGVNVETGEPVSSEPRRVSVGWSRGRHVQIGVGWVEQPMNILVTPTSIMSPPPQTFSVVAGPPDETDEQGRQWRAQWCDMDRHSINQLIRELRKARDEAFERDE